GQSEPRDRREPGIRHGGEARRPALQEAPATHRHARHAPRRGGGGGGVTAVAPRGRYSITSSARASNVGGTTRPSAFAVFRLMTSSKREACTTGRSAGFSPLRMRAA